MLPGLDKFMMQLRLESKKKIFCAAVSRVNKANMHHLPHIVIQAQKGGDHLKKREQEPHDHLALILL